MSTLTVTLTDLFTAVQVTASADFTVNSVAVTDPGDQANTVGQQI